MSELRESPERGLFKYPAQYLTIISKKMKGWNTQWNSLIILMEDVLAKLRVGVSGLLLHFGKKSHCTAKEFFLRESNTNVPV